MDPSELKAALRAQGIRQVVLANALGIGPEKVSKSLSGWRQWKPRELDIIRSMLSGVPAGVPTATLRTIPVIGAVTAGNWREAVTETRSFMAAPDPNLPLNACALEVEGDSMDLFVPAGGRVIFDPEDRSLYSRRFYVVLNGEGETTFKRYFADPARLEPCSSNPRHSTIELGGDEPFTIIGRVIWQASPMPS